MGAYDFRTRAQGKTAREAFGNAVDHARHMHGHGGYTGTIAEKHEFREVTLPAGRSLEDHVEALMEDEFSDKWGPAGCIRVGEGEYLFFGYASS